MGRKRVIDADDIDALWDAIYGSRQDTDRLDREEADDYEALLADDLLTRANG